MLTEDDKTMKPTYYDGTPVPLPLPPLPPFPLFSPPSPPSPPLPSPPHFCLPLSCLCPVMSRALFHPPETTSPVTGDRGMGRGRVLYFLLSTCSPLFSFWGEETWVRRGEGLWVGPALRGCIAGRTWREDGLSLISSSTNPSSSLNCVGGGEGYGNHGNTTFYSVVIKCVEHSPPHTLK